MEQRYGFYKGASDFRARVTLFHHAYAFLSLYTYALLAYNGKGLQLYYTHCHFNIPI